ncbi:hypothetical protein NM208_g1263 [Fusarium decemcellulare]|uniref:Uncharacterized protein n=1 Tax=Fusarium decemcellulare TaxID=57161 RepID=A0ACC1SWG6_9HYPO|nr:hypothetical protein NM208_g1263 [Fusarium decemcellulare]
MHQATWLPTALIFLTGCLASWDRPPPVVHSPTGMYLGNSSISNLDQFLGIPYAKPPVGPLRFSNPVAVERVPFTSINATEYSPGCLQDPVYSRYNGLSEDCLTLNIIRPRRTAKSNAKLPVLFWIHGGGNMNGQSIFYNGTALVQYSIAISQPIIYVGINYRLAGFGFLNSPDFNALGLSNNGLRDQRLALEWTHENIASFGGDPEKVTIFGESAGAFDSWAQLHYAYVKNETNKYFRGMISNSGSPGSVAAPHAYTPESGLAAYRELLSATNCSLASDNISCLRAVPVDTLAPLLVNYSAHFSVDYDWFSDNLTSLLVANEVAPIPIIHGANLNEGAVFLPSIFPDSAIPTKKDLITYIAPFVNSSIELASVVAEIYFNGSVCLDELGRNFNGDATAPDSYWRAVAIWSDTLFHLGRRALLRNACARGVPVWGYHFDQTPPLSLLDEDYEYPGFNQSYARRIGVFHGSDIAYYFGAVSGLKGSTDGDVAVSTIMMRAWISFTYHLDPNAKGVPSWPGYCEGLKVINGSIQDVGTAMFFAQQGDQKIEVRPDTVRQAAYDVWNYARQAQGLSRIY